jgi:hypothetical protein
MFSRPMGRTCVEHADKDLRSKRWRKRVSAGAELFDASVVSRMISGEFPGRSGGGYDPNRDLQSVVPDYYGLGRNNSRSTVRSVAAE